MDLVTEEKKPLAKIAKDTAAGAVLIAAIMAAGVGLIDFCPENFRTYINKEFHGKMKGERIMEGFGENIKKLLLAGIGAVATTAEKSKELLDDMVEKGELAR